MTERLVRGAALSAALAAPFLLLAIILHFAVEVPYWDEWEWTELLYRAHLGTLTFADLWNQHNEHRIFLDNLAAVALDRLGGWSIVREQSFSLVMMVLTQLVLWRIVRRTIGPDVAPLAFLAASLVLYDLVQFENFSWGFQMAWFMADLGVVAVAWMLSDPPDEPRPLLFAVLAATFASLASSQGLLAWPVGLVALVLTRRGAPAIAAWCLWALVVVLTTRNGIAPVSAGHVSVLRHLPELIAYVTVYLGAPIGRTGYIPWCEAAGALALLALAAVFVADVLAKDRWERLARRAPWYALASYAVGCALVTAPARLGFGLPEALASRYSSIALFLYVALVGLGASLLNGLPSPRRVVVALAGTACLAALLAPAFSQGYQLWRQYALERRADVAALRRADAVAVHDLYPDTSRLALYERELREMGDGLFHR